MVHQGLQWSTVEVFGLKWSSYHFFRQFDLASFNIHVNEAQGLQHSIVESGGVVTYELPVPKWQAVLEKQRHSDEHAHRCATFAFLDLIQVIEKQRKHTSLVQLVQRIDDRVALLEELVPRCSHECRLQILRKNVHLVVLLVKGVVVLYVHLSVVEVDGAIFLN